MWSAEHRGTQKDSIRTASRLGKVALAGGARMKKKFHQEDHKRHHGAHPKDQKGALQVGDGQLLRLLSPRLWEVMMVKDAPKTWIKSGIS